MFFASDQELIPNRNRGRNDPLSHIVFSEKFEPFGDAGDHDHAILSRGIELAVDHFQPVAECVAVNVLGHLLQHEVAREALEVEQLGSTQNSCHSNSWFWHEATDTWLVSFPSTAGAVRDTVLHLDAKGATLTFWGQLSDWTFDPFVSTFDYQHGVTFTETGTLLVSTKLIEEHPLYDRRNDTLAVREYELDYKSEVLREVWSFGSDQGIAGNTAGEAHRLANGNTLHNYGSGGRTREINAAGELVWDVMWEDGDTDGPGRLQGKSTFITDLYAFAP